MEVLNNLFDLYFTQTFICGGMIFMFFALILFLYKFVDSFTKTRIVNRWRVVEKRKGTEADWFRDWVLVLEQQDGDNPSNLLKVMGGWRRSNGHVEVSWYKGWSLFKEVSVGEYIEERLFLGRLSKQWFCFHIGVEKV